jgi:hypothetical protein
MSRAKGFGRQAPATADREGDRRAERQASATRDCEFTRVGRPQPASEVAGFRSSVHLIFKVEVSSHGTSLTTTSEIYSARIFQMLCGRSIACE